MTANIYKDIPMLKGIMAQPGRNAFGRLGEQLAYLLLEKRGYRCSFTRSGQKRGDLRVVDPDDGVIYKVEVKTARKASDGKWRFLLWKDGHQDYRRSDFVLLLAVWISGEVTAFVIPVADLGDRSQICISSHPHTYSGVWAAYRQLSSRLSLRSNSTHDTPNQANAAASKSARDRGTHSGHQPGNPLRSQQPATRPAQPGQSYAAAGSETIQ